MGMIFTSEDLGGAKKLCERENWTSEDIFAYASGTTDEEET
jgi:hypothetical protein